jgi:hypothetical protein
MDRGFLFQISRRPGTVRIEDAGGGQAQDADLERRRLVLQITIDQLQFDHIQRFSSHYGAICQEHFAMAGCSSNSACAVLDFGRLYGDTKNRSKETGDHIF